MLRNPPLGRTIDEKAGRSMKKIISADGRTTIQPFSSTLQIGVRTRVGPVQLAARLRSASQRFRNRRRSSSA